MKTLTSSISMDAKDGKLRKIKYKSYLMRRFKTRAPLKFYPKLYNN